MQLMKLLSLALLVQARKDQLDSSQQTLNAAASDSETADAISDFLNDNAGEEPSTTSVTPKAASVASTTSTTTGHALQAKTKQKVTSTTVATTRATTTTTTTSATTSTTTTTTTAAPQKRSTAKAHEPARAATAKPGVFLAKAQQKSDEAQERAELKREIYSQVKEEMEKEFQVELKQRLAEARAKMDTLAKVTAAKTATTTTMALATTSTTTSSTSFAAATSTTVESTRPSRGRKASFVQEGKQATNERKGRATLAAAIAAHSAEQEVEAALRSQAFGSLESEFNVFDMPTYEKTTTTTTTSIATTSSSVKLSRSHWFSGAFLSTEHLAEGIGEKLLSWEQASPVHRVWAKIDGWFAKRGSHAAIATTSKPEVEHKAAEALLQAPHATSAVDQAKVEAERLRDSHVEDTWANFESQDNEFQAELDKDDAMEQS